VLAYPLPLPYTPSRPAGFAPESNTSADLLYSFTDAAADMQVRGSSGGGEVCISAGGAVFRWGVAQVFFGVSRMARRQLCNAGEGPRGLRGVSYIGLLPTGFSRVEVSC
jgi:hypothetical protein